MKYPKAEIERCKEDLLKWIKPGDTIYTINLDGPGHRATHNIKPIIFVDGGPLFPTYDIAVVTEMGANKEMTGVRVLASGMDAGSHLVSRLSQALFGKDFQLQHRALA